MNLILNIEVYVELYVLCTVADVCVVAMPLKTMYRYSGIAFGL